MDKEEKIKKNLEEQEMAAKNWGAAKFLRTHIEQVFNNAVKRGFEKRQSSCPVTPGEQMATVYPCMMTYQHNINNIQGADVMSDPANGIYCE